ncbi:hypothetical protein NR996_00515 [Lactobacillus rodentium]|uniref:HAD family hydrolase n=1 Tax=Lactobacillus rodentium TaxID=947835 RepID=A0A2Z6TDQ7_9LACO|nr:hypothetical protein [Lactobacillus rodentium]MCR1893894.1 hypothetical protein [Lactobacillus rodentium]GBG04240.1 hypothetical protein LrDSM24759_01540 [Lactobacillus rodentium]
MPYKNIILIPEGTIFNEKITERAAIKNTLKKFGVNNFNDKKELFNQLFDRYINEKRTKRYELLLTALLPEVDLNESKSLFYQQLIHQTRLTKNIQTDLTNLSSVTKIIIYSFLPKEVISARLENTNLILDLPIFSAVSLDKFTDIIKQKQWDADETLVIGTNLSDEIQEANDENVDSMWISTGRKVPITPHPTLHMKKFADCLFYVN